MEIILKENVKGLGYKNDIVTVKNGYGRNYLIPTGKAVIASESAQKVLAENLRQQAHKLEKLKNDALALAEKINALEAFTIAAKVDSNGNLYGSVNAVAIADELAKAGFEVDAKMVEMTDAKTLGEHTASVRLHKEVVATVNFNVVVEEA